MLRCRLVVSGALLLPSVCSGPPTVVLRHARATAVRFCSTAAAATAEGAPAPEAVLSSAAAASEANAQLLERAASLRREIFEAWSHPEDAWESADFAAPAETQSAVAGPGVVRYAQQAALARALLDKHDDVFRLDVPRDADVTRALGEAFDRLLLMQVPLPDADGGGHTRCLQLLLDMAGKAGRDIPVTTVQHLFARCSSYPEAISLLYAMRFANINLNVDAYYAMIFSLQRLEEEGWCLRYREGLRDAQQQQQQQQQQRRAEGDTSAGSPIPLPATPEVWDFIAHGTEHQLVPENKPWVGRTIFGGDGDVHTGAPMAGPNRSRTRDFDTIGSRWRQRMADGRPKV